MTDNYMDDDFDTEEEELEEEPQVESPRGLRRAANKSKKLEQENFQLKRELTFLKAGIDLTDRRMNYFVKGYDGELSVEAIREAAIEAGFVQVQEDAAPETQTAAQAQTRVMTASAGAVHEDASEEAAFARLEQAMAEGGVPAMLEVAQQYGLPVTYDE